MPPVAPTVMPAFAAAQIVALTVVAPATPRATATGMSRRATFVAVPGSANRRRSSAPSPTTTAPSTTPIQAGSAPADRTASLIRSMHSRFRGTGRPWPITLVSSATTPRPSAQRGVDLGRHDERRSHHASPAGQASRLAATMAPARHPSASASAGSAPRANDGQHHAVERVSRSGGVEFGDRRGLAVVAHAVDDEHGATVAQLHRRQPVSLPQPLGRIRPVSIP